ncbi:MAG: RagB/SusD family nutrient uptake outer membrane protein [Sphingobacteriaceae bacterium]|nr:MAG: RagB/SusD family nutrient uptake outer membrane protein [Sphingobacteriaceae bacterium]
MKKIYILFLTVCLVSASSCKKYLDINTNPNAPQTVTANLYLSPMLHWMATAPVYDGRFISRYTQNLTLTSSGSSWDLQGYDAVSDNGGELWRDVYWSFGQNLVDMINKAEAEQRWDLLGVGYVLKAWGWQQLTDVYGEIIVKEAIDQTRTTFDYDSQEYAYQEIQRLLNLAITNLQRTDGAVDAAFLGKTDIVYQGDRTKWLKFAYGLLALNLNHYSNKSTYNPDAIIAAVDKSFAANTDNASIKYTGAANDDKNFIGNTRNNFGTYRQTAFIVGLMNGATFTAADPRLSRMLSAAPDGMYRGLITGAGTAGLATTPVSQVPNTIWGTPTIPITGTAVKYLFDDKSRFPIMTYSQLQFIKAEAAYRKNDKGTALEAYTKAISAHIDYVNTSNADISGTPTQITAAEKTAYMAAPAIAPTAATLTLTQIMLQKYIAQWGWGFVETWMDLRRYHYTDLDPATGRQVFLNYNFPSTLDSRNNNKPAYRIRPRYNSEYVWNSASLDKIGALATDYHTKVMWIVQP